jgi:hypothetical protein
MSASLPHAGRRLACRLVVFLIVLVFGVMLGMLVF